MTSWGGQQWHLSVPPNPPGPHTGLGGGNSPLEDVNMGGGQHSLAGEGAGADITVKRAMGAWAQDFWAVGKPAPVFFPLAFPLCNRKDSGIHWGLSLLGMWRAVAGELKYLVTSGCPLQEGAIKVPESVAYLSTLSPGKGCCVVP